MGNFMTSGQHQNEQISANSWQEQATFDEIATLSALY
jgi:hypothetical protein